MGFRKDRKMSFDFWYMCHWSSWEHSSIIWLGACDSNRKRIAEDTTKRLNNLRTSIAVMMGCGETSVFLGEPSRNIMSLIEMVCRARTGQVISTLKVKITSHAIHDIKKIARRIVATHWLVDDWSHRSWSGDAIVPPMTGWRHDGKRGWWGRVSSRYTIPKLEFSSSETHVRSHRIAVYGWWRHTMSRR